MQDPPTVKRAAGQQVEHAQYDVHGGEPGQRRDRQRCGAERRTGARRRGQQDPEAQAHGRAGQRDPQLCRGPVRLAAQFGDATEQPQRDPPYRQAHALGDQGVGQLVGQQRPDQSQRGSPAYQPVVGPAHTRHHRRQDGESEQLGQQEHADERRPVGAHEDARAFDARGSRELG
ncbi:MAG: hypothetical protein JWQ60_987 [Pseudonocardia sp.]|nr:hypothetical protein [Pseudonocardia sp.]